MPLTRIFKKLCNYKTERCVEIFLGEFCGTTFLLVIGCMGSLTTMGEIFQRTDNGSLVFGLATMMVIRIFMYYSGGHVNPIITLVSVLVRMTPILHLPVYLIAQFSGAILGCFIFRFLTPINHLGGGFYDTGHGLKKIPCACSHSIPNNVNIYELLIFEFVVATILCLAWCSVWDHRNIRKFETAILRYSLGYTVLICCGKSFSNTNINPAHSLATALLNKDWDQHWIFWVGPFSGSVFAALIYYIVIHEGFHKKKSSDTID